MVFVVATLSRPFCFAIIMESFVNFFAKFFSVFRRNIAAEFTRESITAQKRIANIIAKAMISDVYLYDEVKYFDDAESRMFETYRYLFKDGKIAVLSMAAQKAMHKSNEFVQFCTSTDDVGIDSIGVYYLFEAVLLHPQLLQTYKSKVMLPKHENKAATIDERIENLRSIIKNYDAQLKEKKVAGKVSDASTDEAEESTLCGKAMSVMEELRKLGER
ncbi:putative protein 4 [Dougjudy virga-like virus]|nr:putative protein 4 [Dougjudy virga-like virus]